jgi:hypothetical protein
MHRPPFPAGGRISIQIYEMLVHEYLIFPVPQNVKAKDSIGRLCVVYIGPFPLQNNWEFSRRHPLPRNTETFCWVSETPHCAAVIGGSL